MPPSDFSVLKNLRKKTMSGNLTQNWKRNCCLKFTAKEMSQLEPKRVDLADYDVASGSVGAWLL